MPCTLGVCAGQKDEILLSVGLEIYIQSDAAAEREHNNNDTTQLQTSNKLDFP